MGGCAGDGILIRPITKERQKDFRGAIGITGSCWDIWPRRLSAEGADRRAYWSVKGVSVSEGNRRDIAKIISAARPVGLLAYRDGEPVGAWGPSDRGWRTRASMNPSRPRRSTTLPYGPSFASTCPARIGVPARRRRCCAPLSSAR